MEGVAPRNFADRRAVHLSKARESAGEESEERKRIEKVDEIRMGEKDSESRVEIEERKDRVSGIIAVDEKDLILKSEGEFYKNYSFRMGRGS